ncbi:hypothetical protein BT96DRAFT_321517 [Gymnopus androsaceus JB14]|uniref:Uncharacterized protein n=1 Tax=Gymnopus androsaceus JB14 TaxID=1447944 RepID=A0A6A4H1P5_9AGAR|nr:hypothetical protein BT96DRAFT_321517 [Gymnopus androsaceus JB14]
MSKSVLRLRCQRSSASASPQTSTDTSLDVCSISTESTRTTPPVELTDTKTLLERLKAVNIDDIILVNEHREMLNDIFNMVESAWTLANLESENSQIIQKDGVLVRTFIPSMTGILRKTIEYIEDNVTNPSIGRSLQSRKTKQKVVTKDLETLRDELEKIHSFAMPYDSPPRSSDRTEDALMIAASIGSALFVLCDSVPVLGTLKPIATGFTEICTTIQTIRSNKQLLAEILRDVREYFRMVLRKVQKSPAAQENEELRRDVEGLFQNLLDVQKTLLKLRKHDGLRLVPFAKRDSENLEALQRRVQHARSTFEVCFLFSGKENNVFKRLCV